ncbi:MAG TPA: ATP-binding protein [Gemmatimonadaceae bacterium]|nr:ATP-binding protein [Gemmatimonadaceae bacterium]
MTDIAPRTPRVAWWRVRLATARRAISPPLLVAVASAVLALGLLQWRHVDSRDRLARSISTLDNVLQTRLHVTRAYMIASNAASGDATFSAADADAALDRASLAVGDWLSGRTDGMGQIDPAVRDRELRRMLLAYDASLNRFRSQLTHESDEPGHLVEVRAAFADLENHHDRIERRAGAVLRDLARRERRDHAITVFLLAFFVLASGLVVDRLTRARNHMEARLREARKMEAIGRLSAGVAHDFNNLLGVILINAEMLHERLPPPDERRVEVDEILTASATGTRLVRQLLTVGRQQPQETRLVELGRLIEDMLPNLQRLAGPDVRVERRIAGATPAVAADLGQMEQVLLNLVANARDAMPAGGRIDITLAPVPRADGRSHARLVVSDTGHGMDEETRSRLFEPFYTTKAPNRGTGLGLATVYGIVEQSRGTITVDSAPGRGATFTIDLPAGAPRQS